MSEAVGKKEGRKEGKKVDRERACDVAEGPVKWPWDPEVTEGPMI